MKRRGEENETHGYTVGCLHKGHELSVHIVFFPADQERNREMSMQAMNRKVMINLA